MQNITVIGVGYVGLVTGTCFADLGNDVCCLDVDEAKINTLNEGGIPIYEPGLEEMVRRNVSAGRLTFTTDYAEALAEAEFVFIAVGTPEGVDGEADLKYVQTAAETVAQTMKHSLILVNKSTVPVGTGDWVSDIVRSNQPQPIDFAVVSNPEFLREGSALLDFMNPDRVVLGSLNQEAANRVAQLYLSLRAPIIVTDLRTAEMIKYASNAFLATKISFINEIANLCERVGADVHDVARAMGLDGRIGRKFLHPGPGFGGSCFPKDTKALVHLARGHNCEMEIVQSTIRVNEQQRERMIEKIEEMVGDVRSKIIGILGLAFKPNTDDMREASSIPIIQGLQARGARIKAYDPEAMEEAKKILKDVTYCQGPYDVAEGSHALVLLTEWNQFRLLDLERIKKLLQEPVLIDLRNVYEPLHVRVMGFRYCGVGR